MFRKKNKRVYLDWAAATPLLPEAKAAMLPFLETEWGNPSSIHKEGMLARQAVETARAQVAESIQVRPEFVTFTGGGTEGNNLAIFGVVEALHSQGREYSSMEFITTRIEHPSIGKAAEHLEVMGVKVKYVGVDETGRIELSHLRELLSEKTVLVSCSYANSEIGAIQPLHSIQKIIKEVAAKVGGSGGGRPDMAQAGGTMVDKLPEALKAVYAIVEGQANKAIS